LLLFLAYFPDLPIAKGIRQQIERLGVTFSKPHRPSFFFWEKPQLAPAAVLLETIFSAQVS